MGAWALAEREQIQANSVAGKHNTHYQKDLKNSVNSTGQIMGIEQCTYRCHQ